MLKPPPIDGNISTQHIPTLLAPSNCKQNRSQHCWAQHVGHPVAMCCDMLRVENRTSAHAQAQHCCTNLAKRLQHHRQYPQMLHERFYHFQILAKSAQHVAIFRNRVAKRKQHVAPNNVRYVKLFSYDIHWKVIYTSATEECG